MHRNFLFVSTGLCILNRAEKTNHCAWRARFRDKAGWTMVCCAIRPFYLPYLSAEEGLVILINWLGDVS